MTTVFLSGSRTITRLNDSIRNRLKNIVDQGLNVVVGDANGADKAVQTYLAATHYQKVIVFCAGRVCRNNIGNWPVRNIDADLKVKGAIFMLRKTRQWRLTPITVSSFGMAKVRAPSTTCSTL